MMENFKGAKEWGKDEDLDEGLPTRLILCTVG